MEAGKIHRILPIFLLSVLLLSCGSSYDGGSAKGTSIKAFGTMSTDGVSTSMVVVNDTRYTFPDGAKIVIDDGASTGTGLKNGMSVKISGIKVDDTSGIAYSIEAENEVQGEVSALQNTLFPPTFEVLGQTVYVDDLTVYSNFSPNSVFGLLNSQIVEVHGQRDAAGNIRATRVELLAANAGVFTGHFEVKGIVSGLTGDQFNIGSLVVNASGAVFEPTGASIGNITNGSLVEVEGTVLVGLTLTASKVQLEDIEDLEFEPGEGEETEVEGYVSAFVNSTDSISSFSLGLVNVTTSATTLYVGGSFEDFMDNIKVEAEGYMTGGTLEAYKIKFKRPRVRIEAEALDAATLLLNTGDSITVLTHSLTDTSGATVFPMASPDRYEVRGYVDSFGNVVAERVEDAGGGGRDILQSPVSSIAGDILTMLGLSIDISTVTEFKDATDTVLVGGKAEFLSLLSVGMEVKVRDNEPNGSWDRAEFEN